MTARAEPRRVRVTVMLGNSLSDRETLALLELLQTESPAEILGLYIEDSELLSLADIPVVREFCRLTRAERRLQDVDLERQFRTQARIAERTLAETVEPHGYPWSFRSLRGNPSALLREALAEVDLLLLGTATNTMPATGRRRGHAGIRPVMVVFDGTEPAEHALRVALKLADSRGTGLVIVLSTSHSDVLPALREDLAGRIGERTVDLVEITSDNTAELLNRLRRYPAAQLVLGIPASGIDDDAITLLRNRSTCPVILVK